MTERMSLKSFRVQVDSLMNSPTLRPFVCAGSPLECQVFIVGFNPATSLGKPFWSFWDDEHGFSKSDFMAEYLRTRALKGVRPRIERIVAELPAGTCLETNICSQPTKNADELPDSSRATAVFEFLLRSIQPQVVYLHSNEPIKYFRRFLDEGVMLKHEEPLVVDILGRRTTVFGTSGPLWRVSYSHAEFIGRELNELLAKALPYRGLAQ